MILGHEAVGVVADAGDAVGTLHPGDRVVLNLTFWCGRCRACRRGMAAHCGAKTGRELGMDCDGTLAHAAVLQERFVHRLPEEIVDHRAHRSPDVPRRAARRRVRIPALPLGANCGMRRDAWQRLGGFAEGYVVASEDVELFWRAQLGGYEMGYAAGAAVHYRLPDSVRGLARQAFAYGRSHPRLYRDFARFGMPRSAAGRAAPMGMACEPSAQHRAWPGRTWTVAVAAGAQARPARRQHPESRRVPVTVTFVSDLICDALL